MRPGKELRHIINPRAAYLARGPDEAIRPAQIVMRLVLAMVLLGCLAFLLTRLFAAI